MALPRSSPEFDLISCELLRAHYEFDSRLRGLLYEELP